MEAPYYIESVREVKINIFFIFETLIPGAEMNPGSPVSLMLPGKHKTLNQCFGTACFECSFLYNKYKHDYYFK